MSGREIVTLQLGHYSNFTGAHWWNLQEASFVYDPKLLQSLPKEVNHDVLFREGRTLKGEVTFTPRLVALDLRGSLNSLKLDGTLYSEDKEEEIKWSGDVTLHKSTADFKNQFLQDLDRAEGTDDGKEETGCGDQNSVAEDEEDENSGEAKASEAEAALEGKFYELDEQVKVWSDYLSVHLHPRSLQIVQDYAVDSEDQPFDVFGLGQKVLSGEAWDLWEDKVRFFTEECDLLQGFHVLFDNHNSFAGAASKVLNYLSDEFPGKAVLSLPLTPAVLPDQTAAQRATRILNTALSVGTNSADSSLYVPLSLASSLWRNLGAPRSLPHLSYNCDLHYHTSAVLAACLDTMTMPVRQENNSGHLSDLTSALSHMGRKVASLSASFPFPMLERDTFSDALTARQREGPWHPVTPHIHSQARPTAQFCVVRGVPANKIKRDGSSSLRNLSTCSSVDDVLQLYLTETYHSTMNAGCVMRDPVSVASPFPHIFQPSVTRTGLLSGMHRNPRYGVDSVPMVTSLQSSPGVKDYLCSLHAEAGRFNIRRHHHFLEAGLEEEDFKDTLDSLQSLADCYTDHQDSL